MIDSLFMFCLFVFCTDKRIRWLSVRILNKSIIKIFLSLKLFSTKLRVIHFWIALLLSSPSPDSFSFFFFFFYSSFYFIFIFLLEPFYLFQKGLELSNNSAIKLRIKETWNLQDTIRRRKDKGKTIYTMQQTVLLSSPSQDSSFFFFFFYSS